MKKIFNIYSEILKIIYQHSPLLIFATIISSVITGLLSPFSVWVNSTIFNVGLSVASGELPIRAYLPYLLLFFLVSVMPVFVGDIFLGSCVMPRCRLLLRTTYKEKLLKKLKRIRYEHIENRKSAEIIDKTYNRIEGTVLSLFPRALGQMITSAIASAGILWMLGTVRWWLLPLLLLPFALETWFSRKFNKSISDEMETYWQKEKSYEILSGMLRSKNYIQESRLMGAANHLVDTYESRMKTRNREYEGFFLRHLRQNFAKQNLTRLSQLFGALSLFYLYLHGELTIGLLISLTVAILKNLFSQNGLNTLVKTYRTSDQVAKTFEFYDEYFALSEDEYGDEDSLPEQFDIRFENVYFTYPGSEKPVLNGVSFHIKSGEKISLVGANGEGKSTLVKLLMGLFEPDSGRILIGGKPLSSYTERVRSKLFAPVFQDFFHYSITLGENVGIGDIERINDREAINKALQKANADHLVTTLLQGTDTLLGRDFEGGVDLSGGQWQRIAIARAFMGDKPILVLDEPTSQLDPLAENRLFEEFAELSTGKTALFISHRLGSATITDRILVLQDGKIVQSGSHAELLKTSGLYADMFASQKQWYTEQRKEANHD